ncbi:unnamed protein product [Caenorhabditis auriculariae]|uniref:Uncharacterized protein n=1 Tax=Caenorhabditis auriculariae TaxID=2777116 RepID=A0A8S1H269_9PELO|nr:unnamed protein product [Caenorhabditis auriculariae]
MPSWVVVVLAITAGVLAVFVLLLVFFFLLNKSRSKQQQTETERSKPVRAESRVRPKIPNPIYTIHSNSIEKGNSASDTVTTRKLSMMFDSKKRFSTAFSQRSAYFDFENSPLPRHKEYLDFNDIENILPKTETRPAVRSNPSISILNEVQNGKRGPATASRSEAVKQVFAEDEISFNKSVRPIFAN